jgi:hypothetical protein
MSIAEIERFAADVSSNAALHAEAEKSFTQGGRATPFDGVIAFATAKGYSFTAIELRDHVRAKTQGGGRQVTDDELDAVAGGFLAGGSHPFTMMIGMLMTGTLLNMLPSGKSE